MTVAQTDVREICMRGLRRSTPRPPAEVRGAWFSRIALAAVFVFLSIGDARAGAANPKEETHAFPFFEPVTPPRPIQVMVHRGLMQQAPENSRPALEMCVGDFLEWAEVDLRLSKDGVHVLFHDSDVSRTSDGKGFVADLTVAALKKLDIGSSFARRFAGQRILTLAEALTLAKGRLNLYLDCKAIDPTKLVAEISQAGMETQTVVYAGKEIVARIKALSEGRIATMTKWTPSDGFDTWVKTIRPAAVEIDADHVTPEICRRFHDLGIKVQAMTLGATWDQQPTWSRISAAGVDWVQTDRPYAFLAYTLSARKIKRPVQVACHRGASRQAPENTVAAIEAAIATGADYVEVDVRTTRDKKHYLLHDGQLNRTTSGKGPISEVGEADVIALDAGSWFGKPFAGARVPAFDQALAAMQGHCSAYVDAKDISPADTLTYLARHQMLEHSVVYGGVDYLKALKKLDPRIRALPPLKNESQLDTIAAELKPYGVDAAWQILSPELIDKCHALGIRVFSDALGAHETVPHYLEAIGWGIDVIQTDHPARVLRAIELATQHEDASR